MTLDFSGLQAPVLGLFAENDGFVTPDVARKLHADVTSSGKSMELKIYDGADHGFHCDQRGTFHESARNDSWSRVKHLD